MEKDYLDLIKAQIDSGIDEIEIKKLVDQYREEIKQNLIGSGSLNDFLEEEKEKLLDYLTPIIGNNYIPSINNKNISDLLKNVSTRKSQEMLLDFLSKANARNFLNIYIDLFNNKAITDQFKTRLFFLLAEQQVDQEFLMRKSFKRFVVNPCHMDVVEKMALLGKMKQTIDIRVSYDNPGWAHAAYIIAENYFYVAFPDWPDSAYARNSLAFAVLDTAKEMLGIDEDINFKPIEYSTEYVKEFKVFFKRYGVLD